MFKKFSIIVTFLIIAIVISIIVVLMIGRHEFDTQKKAWIALGGTLDPAELAPPVIPDSENAAVAYGVAFVFLDGLSNDEINLLGDDPAKEPDVIAVLEKSADVITQLREASEMENCRWDIDYAAGFDALLPHLSQIRRAARLLVSDARQAAEDGRDMDVVRDIETILRLGMHATNDPTLIGQFVAASTLEQGVSAYEELFRDHAAPLNAVSSIIEKYDGRVLLRQALITEGAMSQALVDRPGDWQQNGMGSLPPYAGLMRSWDRAYYLQIMGGMVVLCDQDYFDASIDEPTPPFYAVTSRLLLPALSRAGYPMSRDQLRISMLETAEKLRSYKAAHGAYPEPDDDSAIKMPIDALTGKRLSYEKVGEGFVLRSEMKEGSPNGKQIQWVWEE